MDEWVTGFIESLSKGLNVELPEAGTPYTDNDFKRWNDEIYEAIKKMRVECESE